MYFKKIFLFVFIVASIYPMMDHINHFRPYFQHKLNNFKKKFKNYKNQLDQNKEIFFIKKDILVDDINKIRMIRFSGIKIKDLIGGPSIILEEEKKTNPDFIGLFKILFEKHSGDEILTLNFEFHNHFSYAEVNIKKLFEYDVATLSIKKGLGGFISDFSDKEMCNFFENIFQKKINAIIFKDIINRLKEIVGEKPFLKIIEKSSLEIVKEFFKTKFKIWKAILKKNNPSIEEFEEKEFEEN
jgi:hypothetical protein